MQLNSLEIRSFPADALIIATGGIGAIFGKSTNSLVCTGSAQAALYQQGADYANGEFIQVHPTAIPGEDKLRLMSESARGEGGRIWVPATPGDKRAAIDIPERERWYFLEQKYPKYGNLVPRDIATREIFQICLDGFGVDGKMQVYLDLTEKSPKELDQKLGGILEIYQMFVGEDPRRQPMRVFPGMHYTMGGLWVDYLQQTSLPGVFAIGECDFSIHGANRLGANSLVSCIYAGFVAGPAAVNYARGLVNQPASNAPFFQAARQREEEINRKLIKQNGNENAYALHAEMGKWMTENVTVIRDNARLRQTDEKLCELLARYQNIDLNETNFWATQSVPHARDLYNMLILARVITLSALARDESRGAHYKPEFPNRDDEQWLKTTIAHHSEAGPELSYRPIDVSLVTPRLRQYN